ncbi:hypothetical protein NRIC_05700 [Enterococcus florum]|uniref:N-acetyltransferase domain-containing protein n=1 Tax=Enterococcus florum TaxID=2480627 RepID=A0A4V0WP55_9ENTE|nr:GNAT family N-acetyltransferase [Enterococcus florum]GCF92679.1 hypothetical protein NRIC_05700 [Enterococcus florum]
MKIQLAPTFSKQHFEAITLREQILGTTVNLNQEAKRTTFVAIEEGKVVGTAAIQLYPFGFARIRQVAVSPDSQKRHIGSQLMDRCEAFAREQRAAKVILTGRKSASLFYLKRDYHVFLFPFSKHQIDFFWFAKKLETTPYTTEESL